MFEWLFQKRTLMKAKAKQYDLDRWRTKKAKPMKIFHPDGRTKEIMVAPDGTVV